MKMRTSVVTLSAKRTKRMAKTPIPKQKSWTFQYYDHEETGAAHLVVAYMVQHVLDV